MQKKCLVLLAILTFVVNNYGVTNIDHIITFFIQPLTIDEETEAKKKETFDKLQHTLTTPGKVSYKIIKSHITNITGILVTYRGYLVISNSLGQIMLPRFTQQPNLSVLITEKIEPVMMIGNTVHHWELAKNISAKMYSLERKQDAETKLVYWEYKESPLPVDSIIPLNTIVLLTKPKNIVVPLGITLTDINQQWVLPTLYATKNVNTIEPALSILKVRQFFGPINVIQKKISDTNYASQISTQ